MGKQFGKHAFNKKMFTELNLISAVQTLIVRLNTEPVALFSLLLSFSGLIYIETCAFQIKISFFKKLKLGQNEPIRGAVTWPEMFICTCEVNCSAFEIQSKIYLTYHSLTLMS